MFTNNNEMMNFINTAKQSNPQEFVTNMVRNSANEGNPVMKNLYNLIQTGNTKEIETVARNIAAERGIDFDKEFNSFRQMFRL